MTNGTAIRELINSGLIQGILKSLVDDQIKNNTYATIVYLFADSNTKRVFRFSVSRDDIKIKVTDDDYDDFIATLNK